ncbi:hypothetical protein YC2023_026082 [Brassica napus]
MSTRSIIYTCGQRGRARIDGLHHWSKPTKHELCCGDAYYLERVTSYDLADRAGVETDSLLLTRLRIFPGPGYLYEEMLSEFHNQIGVVITSKSSHA